MRPSRLLGCLVSTLLPAALIWTAAAGAGDPPSLQRAKELFKARQYAESLEACNQAIAEDPAYAESYRQRALCRQRLGDLPGALADLDRAIAVDPTDATSWSSRSSLKRRMKDAAGAWADIERAAALAPDNAHILNNRGLLRYDRGDYPGAVDDYTRALRADPRMSAAYNNRGLAREKLGDLKGALADYTQAVEFNPRNADAFSNRAYCRNRMGDATGARQDYAQALAIEPGHDFATKQLAKLGGGPAGGSRPDAGAPTGPSTAGAIPPSGTPVRLPTLTFEASDPCATAAQPRDGMPWQTPGRLPTITRAPGSLPAAAALPPFADFNRISQTQYNGEVSMAMEGMRLLYGPMSPEDEQRFQTAWAPLFDHPTPEAAEYLRRLIPLLGQFLAGREAFIRTAVAVEASLRDAAVGVAAGTRDCYLD
ncbi:MAG TPA: tetratricopeptide repeat protein, partial [Acidobacteriota bacterium]|nr:tetratricopeptide repeat protein [Acidobacteriota bacterium]